MTSSLISRCQLLDLNAPTQIYDYNPKVICDANVLYSVYLRDLILQLASRGIFEAHWTKDIQEEWSRNLKGVPEEKIASLIQLMNQKFPKAFITGYEPLADQLKKSLTLKDSHDAHVIAAAVHGKANYIVTFNLVDFRSSYLQEKGIEAIHPDFFLSELMSSDQAAFYECVKEILARSRKPPLRLAEYMSILTNNNLPDIATQIRRYSNGLTMKSTSSKSLKLFKEHMFIL